MDRSKRDPELTVAQWWQLMADARLSHTMLSEEAGGRGWSRALNHVALSVMADKGFWDHRQGSV